VRGSLRAGVRVDRRGITQCYAFGWRRRVRWDQIVNVDLRPNGATIQTTRGPIELDPKLNDWMKIAAQCIEALGQTMPRSLDTAAVVELPPQEVAQWLGLHPDQTMTCVSTYHQLYGVYNTLGVLGCCVLGCWSSTPSAC